MRAPCFGISLSVALGATCSLAAEPERSRARLELARASGTESCVEERELELAVERRLRRTVFQEPAELVVGVSVERRERGWSAEIVLHDAKRRELGRRELETQAKDCSALDASLALVVALLVDAPPEPPPAPEAPAAAPEPRKPRPAPTPLELPEETFAPREPWRFVPTLAVDAAVDRLPGFAFGPRAGVAFLPPRFPELRVSVGVLLPRELTEEPDPFGGRFWLVDARVELCPLELETPSVRLSGCVGQSVGRLSVAGVGFDRNEETATLDVVLTVGVSSWLFLAGPVGVRLGLGAGFPLSRNSYGARAAGGARLEVWKRGFVLGTGELAVGVEL